MKVKLDSINRYDKTSKNGKEYVSVVIEAEGKKYSGFGDIINENWKDGDTVNIEVEQKGSFLNFTAIPFEAGEGFKDMKQLDRIEGMLKELLTYFQNNKMYIESNDKSYPYPTLDEARAMNKDNPNMEKGDIDERFVTEEVINSEESPF